MNRIGKGQVGIFGPEQVKPVGGRKTKMLKKHKAPQMRGFGTLTVFRLPVLCHQQLSSLPSNLGLSARRPGYNVNIEATCVISMTI